MKVFISWSGSRSKDLANALREWLPMVLQYVEPWVSDKDISAGERWAQAIAGELDASNFGIICITPENLNSEWILFESGALSKSMLDAKVIPLLFGLELSDLSGPLSQFQAQKVEEIGVMEVIRAINKVAEKPASSQIVDQLVPTLWPRLQDTLSRIPAIAPTDKHKRSSHEILEELVTGVRGLSSRMREMDPEASGKERFMRRRRMRLHPAMFEEIALHAAEADDSPTVLLIIAGIWREDFPWLSEILIEAYREIKGANGSEVEQIVTRLYRTVMQLARHPIMRELARNSEEGMIMAEELPMILDVSLRPIGEETASAIIKNNSAGGRVTTSIKFRKFEGRNMKFAKDLVLGRLVRKAAVLHPPISNHPSLQTPPHSFGKVTPRWPIYLPARSA